MAKIEITKTDLVWPGKYNDDRTRKKVPRVSLPFQVTETISESSRTANAGLTWKGISAIFGKPMKLISLGTRIYLFC